MNIATYRIFVIFVAVSLIYLWYAHSAEYSRAAVDEAVPLVVRRVDDDDSNFFGVNVEHVLVPRNVCNESSIAIRTVQIVTSYAGEVVARSALRRAYPARELFDLGVWRVFLLARTKPHIDVDASQDAIVDESRRFGDLLQGDFYESYRNLTYKHLMGLRWVAHDAVKVCPGIKFVFKMDDDIVVNLYKMVELAEAFDRNSTWDFIGHVFANSRPIRRRANKWYVSKQEYDLNYYPKFVSGWFYVTRPSTASKIVENARFEQFFWVDDVFLTGVVAETFNATYVRINRHFSRFPELMVCCAEKKLDCEFLVSPTGGDFNLQLVFQKHAHSCAISPCSTLEPPKNISQICFAKKTLPQLSRGFPIVKEIRLSLPLHKRDALCSLNVSFVAFSGLC